MGWRCTWGWRCPWVGGAQGWLAGLWRARVAYRSFQMMPPCEGSYLHLPDAAETLATAVLEGSGILMTTFVAKSLKVNMALT